MRVGSTTNLCRREAPAEVWGLVPEPTFAKGRPVRKVGGWFHNQPLQKGNPCGRLGVGSTTNLTISNPRLRVGGWFWNQPLIKGWFHGQKVGGWGLVVAPTLNQRLVGWLGVGSGTNLGNPRNQPFEIQKSTTPSRGTAMSRGGPGAMLGAFGGVLARLGRIPAESLRSTTVTHFEGVRGGLWGGS